MFFGVWKEFLSGWLGGVRSHVGCVSTNVKTIVNWHSALPAQQLNPVQNPCSPGKVRSTLFSLATDSSTPADSDLSKNEVKARISSSRKI